MKGTLGQFVKILGLDGREILLTSIRDTDWTQQRREYNLKMCAALPQGFDNVNPEQIKSVSCSKSSLCFLIIHEKRI